MSEQEDYYAVLGIEQGASSEVIKRAYIDKCFILHPDRLQGAPESARISAEQELKKVNRAYETLKDPKKKKDYDSKQKVQQEKPIPIIEPKSFEFKDIRPLESWQSSFVIRNGGAPYKKIWFSNPNNWIRIISWKSLSPSDELPLEVNFEVEAPNAGKSFSEFITVQLDEESTSLSISLLLKSEVTNKPTKSRTSLIKRLFGVSDKSGMLKPPFTLTDYRWHEIEKKSLPKWISKQRDKLDAGQELVGRTFRYRRNSFTKNYQIKLRYKRKQGIFR